ncbi:retrotransposon protein, putative, ty1-copia subclass, partial [Tanacetum coccineum]
KKRGLFQEYIFQAIFSNGGSSVLDSDLEFSSAVIAMNSSNLAKSFSSRMVPSMEWRISLPSIDVKDHSFSSNSEIELLLLNSNYCIGSVKKRSSLDMGNFTVFFHFKNNKIGWEGRNNNHRKKMNTDAGTGSFTESDGTLNDTNTLKEVVSPSIIDEPVAMEVQSLCKKVGNICTLFTSRGMGLMLLYRWSRSELSVKGLCILLMASSWESECFMDGLNLMLENGPWFIHNHPLILHKWNPDVDLLKEDVGNVPDCVKLHGVLVTAFSEDGLSAIATKLGTPLMLNSYTSDMCLQSWGRSSYARVIIELWADVELKDNIVVFGHTQEEYPKSIRLGVAKNLKKPSQTSRGVPVGPKVGFKPYKEYRPVPKKPTTSPSGNKKKGVTHTNEVSNSNPFDVLNSVDNDVEKFEDLLIDRKVILVDEVGNPLKKVIECPGDYDSENEVALDDNDMARSLGSKKVGFSTQSFLSYGNGDYDKDPYDDDMYEGQDLPQEIQTICDNLDI